MAIIKDRMRILSYGRFGGTKPNRISIIRYQPRKFKLMSDFTQKQGEYDCKVGKQSPHMQRKETSMKYALINNEKCAAINKEKTVSVRDER